MGIQGLLPLLKSIHRPTELKKYAGETFGVDAYGWLHRGAVSCAIELAQGKPTRRYVDFAMNRVRMLKHFGIIPYLVFDGDFLPSKAGTEASREKRREETRKAGLELLKAGKPAQAFTELQKAIDVTPEMARHLIEELKKAGVQYVVAPYEADAQLVYLERQGLITGILSEDSDLLVFGAKRLLTKLGQHGECVEINRRDFCACREVSLTGWTDTEFRHMAILSGCDYLDSVNNLGLKTAYRLIRKHKTPDKTIRMLQFDGKYRLPADYLKLFRQAELTFLYQWVFCPNSNTLVNLTSPTADIDVDKMDFIGSYVEADLAKRIAVGEVNPITKQEIVVSTLPSPRKRTASTAARSAMGSRPPPQAPANKPIDSYFEGHRRIPLGEMEPNCFEVNPERVAAMTDNGNRSIVFPLPRPYLDDAAASTSSTTRTYINRNTASPRALRRRTEPVSNLLNNASQSQASSRRRQTSGPLSGTLNTARSSNDVPSQRPPKKARLCEDEPGSPATIPEKSKFFLKTTQPAKTRKSEGYLMSDDSIEDAMKELPDVDGWQSPVKGKKEIMVFTEGSPRASQERSSKDDDFKNMAFSFDAADSGPNMMPPPPPLSQASLSRFNYAPSGTTRTRRDRTSTSSIDSLLSRSTPPSSVSSSVARSRFSVFSDQSSTSQTTPATPAMTPLQRLGAQAMNRGNQPPTPTFAAPRPKKSPSAGRRSLDALPINPSFVPLPPVDVEEVEALHRPIGSEDMLASDSENDDVPSDNGVENVKHGKKETGQQQQQRATKKPDLSRFLFG